MASFDLVRIEAGVPHRGPAFNGENASEGRYVLFFSARKRPPSGELEVHDGEEQFTTSTALVELAKLIYHGAVNFNLSDSTMEERVAFAGQVKAIASKVLAAGIISAGTYHPDQYTSRLLGTVNQPPFEAAVAKHFMAVELQRKHLLHSLGQGTTAVVVAKTKKVGKRKKAGKEVAPLSVSDMLDLLGSINV
jgi:hypothetical protein